MLTAVTALAGLQCYNFSFTGLAIIYFQLDESHIPWHRVGASQTVELSTICDRKLGGVDARRVLMPTHYKLSYFRVHDGRQWHVTALHSASSPQSLVELGLLPLIAASPDLEPAMIKSF
jgi:hypothetical protein